MRYLDQLIQPRIREECVDEFDRRLPALLAKAKEEGLGPAEFKQQLAENIGDLATGSWALVPEEEASELVQVCRKYLAVVLCPYTSRARLQSSIAVGLLSKSGPESRLDRC